MAEVEIIVQLSEPRKGQSGQISAAAQRASVEALVRSHGAVLVPLHPDSDDPNLNRTFAIQMSDQTRAEELALQLRAHPGIEAAYIKPPGEPP